MKFGSRYRSGIFECCQAGWRKVGRFAPLSSGYAASPENGDVSIRFRFERLPFSDVDPAFETESVTLSGGSKSYCVSIASRPADETYSSFILYSNTRNTYFGLADTVVTEGDSCATIPVIRNPDAVPVAPAWLLVMMGMAIAGFGLRKLQAA
jgi:hypothetical protein